MNITMYMVTHKKVDFIPKGRTPICVGGCVGIDGAVLDSTGESISYKNKNYCELTAMYWIWKNDFVSDVVSIEHYRRFWRKKKFIPRILYKSDIDNLLNNYDLVVSRYFRTKMKNGDYYKKWHYEEDLILAKEAIISLCPEYEPSFNKVMNDNKLCLLNMLIMRKADYNKYCEWLFEILSYVEERTDLSDRTEYQKRIYGFLGERLFNVWLDYQDFNVGRLKIYYKDGGKIKSIIKSLYHSFSRPYNPKGERK